MPHCDQARMQAHGRDGRATGVRLSRLALLLLAVIVMAAASAPHEYTNNFESATVGKVPDDIMVLDGTFTIAAERGNKCLELASDPVGEFGALLGPAFGPEVDLKARVWAAASGKRFPEFGIGAGDAGGFKLFVAPGRHVLELRGGEETRASAPVEWKGGAWTWLRLRINKQGAQKWLIRGKAWPQEQKEPAHWMISTESTAPPPAGRMSVWGEAFSEQPIRFDDLSASAD
jgi:hypothetical protein